MFNLKALAASAAVLAFTAFPVNAAEDFLYTNVKASWYKMGKVTGCGEAYNPNGFTAAHKTLPCDTRLVVTNMKNGKSVEVRVNDRGPFIPGREFDLSMGAAREIGMISDGIARINVKRA